MARSLLVTLADERYLEPAKALFGCVHGQCGWSGDLMLLAHEVPEEQLAAFRERGVLVKRCEAWFRDEQPGRRRPVTALSKFQLFTPEFRRWENVLYLDGDMMFWASLDRLARVRGLAAVGDRTPLAAQFPDRDGANRERWRELEARCDPRREIFNSGLLAFRTDVIRDDSFTRLTELYLRYHALQQLRDQPTFNLYFYGAWKRVPDFYAALFKVPAKHFGIPDEKLRLIGRHFAVHPRPWHPGHAFHAEWLHNRALFEALDARQPRPPRAVWSGFEVQRYWAWLHVRRAGALAWRRVRPGWRWLRGTRPARRLRWLVRRLRALLAR